MASSNDANEDVPRIGRFEQSEPVHAQCDQPRFSFRNLIGIDLGQCQSISMDEIRLGADVSFEAIELTIDGLPYEFSLAAATVLIEKENADIRSGSRYKHTLRPGSIDSSFEHNESVVHGYDLSTGVDLSLTEKSKVSLKGGASRKADADSAKRLKVEYEVTLVQPAGQDSWRLGGPDGNPLIATRDLRGTIINSFRQGEMTPLCTLSVREPAKPISGRLRVQASPTDFRLRSKRQVNPSAPPSATASVADGLRADQIGYRKRAAATEASLKERVAAMALLKRHATDEPMLDLAERAFSISPLADQSGDEG